MINILGLNDREEASTWHIDDNDLQFTESTAIRLVIIDKKSRTGQAEIPNAVGRNEVARDQL